MSSTGTSKAPQKTTEAKEQLTCFVIIGFGKKSDPSGRVLNLDKTFEQLIRPACDTVNVNCFRAIDANLTGSINKLMYKWIYEADFVIADLSTLNANVFYELGVRHALKPNTTVILAESVLMQDIPFDLSAFVIHKYEHGGDQISAGEQERFVNHLSKVLEGLIEDRNEAEAKQLKRDPDSPVFDSLVCTTPPAFDVGDLRVPKYLPPDQRKREASEDTVATEGVIRDGASLASIITAAEAAKQRGDLPTAIRLFEQSLDMQKQSEGKFEKKPDPYLAQQLALVTYMLGTRRDATGQVDKAVALPALNDAEDLLRQYCAPEISTDPETLELSGDINKRRFELTGDPDDLERARRFYERGFHVKQDHKNGSKVADTYTRRAGLLPRAAAIASFGHADLVRRKVVGICSGLMDDEKGFASRADKQGVYRSLALAYQGLGQTDNQERIEQKLEGDATEASEDSYPRQKAELARMMKEFKWRVIRRPQLLRLGADALLVAFAVLATWWLISAGSGGLPLPTASAVATPASVPPGSETTLNWFAANAPGVMIEWSAPDAADESRRLGAWGPLSAIGSMTFPVDATTTYRIVAENESGTAVDIVRVDLTGPPPIRPVLTGPPCASLYLDPAGMATGSGAILTWSTSNAAEIQLVPLGPGPFPPSGSATVSPPSATTYVLTATNAVGVSAEDTITVPGSGTNGDPVSGFGQDRVPCPSDDIIPDDPDIADVTDDEPTVPTSTPALVLTATLDASSVSVESGQSLTLFWSTSNAEEVLLDDSPVGQSGRTTVSPPVGVTTYTLVASRPGRPPVSDSLTVTTTLPREPTVTFGANSTSIEAGESTMLFWSTSNAEEVLLNDRPVAPTGQMTISPPTGETTYTLVASRPGRPPVRDAVTVTTALPAAPIVTLGANSTSIESGQSTMLFWSTSNAEEVLLNDRPVAPTGQMPVSPPTGETTYTLVASRPGRPSVSDSLVITAVLPTPVATLEATAIEIEAGASTTLIWSTSNAETVRLDGRPVAPSGRMIVSPPTGVTTYRLVASNPGGDAEAPIVVTVRPPDPCSAVRFSPGWRPGCGPDSASAPQ